MKKKSFCEKIEETFGAYDKTSYLCTRNHTAVVVGHHILGYGVMVTLQILVLPFLVRVRVAQQKVKRCNIVCDAFFVTIRRDDFGNLPREKIFFPSIFF